MTGKRSPEYHRNARTVRTLTNAKLNRGEPVRCIQCGGAIQPGQRFDVCHIIDASRGGTDSLNNLGPGHTRENRSDGGRLGAARRHTSSRRAKRLPVW